MPRYIGGTANQPKELRPVANSFKHGRAQFLLQRSTEQFWLESSVMPANKPVSSCRARACFWRLPDTCVQPAD